MFEEKTVIILGAGASAPFGFALGGELYNFLIDRLGAWHRKHLGEELPSYRGPFSAQNVSLFRKDPIGALVSYLKSPLPREFLPKDFSQDAVPLMLVEFREQLRGQTSDTIDRFIHDNPGHQLIGKILLAQNILLRMYSGSDDSDSDTCLSLRTFSKRSFGSRRNWYHGLMNHMRLDASDGKAVANNKLTIVTFNYDSSLELALASSLGRTERHAGADWQQAVRVLHINGGPPVLNQKITDVGRFIVQSAKTITLVEDEPDEDLSHIRGTARHAIQDADKIFVIGFNFDSANVATIGLTDVQKSKVYCLNYDGNLGLANRIRKLGIADRTVSGEPDNPRHIDSAIDEGILEQ